MQPYQKWIFSGLLTASASCFAAQPSSQNMNDSKSPPVGQSPRLLAQELIQARVFL